MSVQIISNNGDRTEDLISSSLVSLSKKEVVILLKSYFLTDDQKEFLTQDGLLVSYHHDEKNIKTQKTYIETAVCDGGSVSALESGQWLVRFERIYEK